MPKMSTRLLYLFIAVIVQIDASVSDTLVQLPNGLIQGREDVTVSGKTYYAFEKVPYAAPPTGKLRFQAPVPPEDWEGVLNTTYLDIACMQLNSHFLSDESEDCLYLNIFTPQLPSDENNVSLPVMLFIHGGGLATGSAIRYKSDFLIDNDIILIAINYRVGIFGFLSTKDDVIPGNAGLKDQLLALQWTHDNINLFGGNPDKITIFGQSAGAVSCSYHLLNQKSKGLFSGAILHSGSALLPGDYQRDARKVAFDTAALLNENFTTSDDSVALLDFLQTVDATELTETAESYLKTVSGPEYRYHGKPYAAVVEAKNENAIITKKQYGLLQGGNVIGVPVIMGITSEEALAFVFDYSNPISLALDLNAYDEHLDWLVPGDMMINDESKRTEIGSRIRELYTGGQPFHENWGAGIRYYSDNGYTRPVIAQAKLYSQFAKTYFYQFSYKGELGTPLDVHYDGAESVGHAEDISYIFCYYSGCDLTGYPESDRLTSERLIKMWTNFAKYQNPTPEPLELLQNITWPQFLTENSDFPYVDINENLEIKNNPKEETYSKWVEIYNSLNYTDFDTY